MGNYKNYSPDTRVRIKSTGQEGEAFESALGFISVFIDGEKRCSYHEEKDVEFLNDEKEN